MMFTRPRSRLPQHESSRPTSGGCGAGCVSPFSPQRRRSRASESAACGWDTHSAATVRNPPPEVSYMSEPAHVLLVAHHTAATPALLAAVSERARRSPATFHLVVPREQHGMHKVMDPQDTGDSE